MMKNRPYKKYIYASLCLFCAIVLSIIVFFLIFRLDDIQRLFRHILSTLMPFIIGIVLAYIICPMCSAAIVKYYPSGTDFAGKCRKTDCMAANIF